ncbi:DUF4331 domain-containing protein [Lysobacter sp. KIS68-7]|uniref:DUF4331 family protein n=1 Tax=Lysobacter sp. KIS68-7 TaxID=2904252 RepID=UPI001E4F37CF|nr:DUF4331 family protein [Lysobacter sp. KIS68-7]UHQ19392.1 DUF4331 domain-containing protein [Lysobacter sp. KIS68-7]
MSDHFSGPMVMGDPAVDITDFYAFPSPERAGNLVLVMDVFPMATAQACFSDIIAHRFRLRPLEPSDGRLVAGAVEYAIDVTFSDLQQGGSAQSARLATSCGRRVDFAVGTATEQDGIRVFAGLASDPFFMDVEAALRTDMSGKLSFDTATNTVELRDVLVIAIELPYAPIRDLFGGASLVSAVAETAVTRSGKPMRIERVGRPEIKNVVMANPTRDPRTFGIELRDIYNREDTFALSPVYRPLYESRMDANLAFFDRLDDACAWPLDANGRHPLRDVLMDDFLVLDLAKPFAPGGFLEIERAFAEQRPHATAGGRWLDDDILDELLTWMVNARRGPRFGDGVDAPTKPASLRFPYVRDPNHRSDLPLPAFLRT